MKIVGFANSLDSDEAALMSHLICSPTACPVDFEFLICSSLDETIFEVLQMQILNFAVVCALFCISTPSRKASYFIFINHLIRDQLF